MTIKFDDSIVERLPYLNLVGQEPPKYCYAGYVEKESLRCDIYIFYWPYQDYPEHEHDYEPIFIFSNGEIAFDSWHYVIGRGTFDELPIYIKFVESWRAIRPSEKVENAVRDYKLRSLNRIVEDMKEFGFNTKLFTDPFLINSKDASGAYVYYHFWEEPTPVKKDTNWILWAMTSVGGSLITTALTYYFQQIEKETGIDLPGV